MLMSRRSAVLTFVGCFLAVVAFQWLGLAWSFADVHPGGDVAADPVLTRRAELGAAMHEAFRVPLEWMRSAVVRLPGGSEFLGTSGYATLNGWVHWLVLPVIYGMMLWSILRLLIRFFSRRESGAA
jgi:hypothetical protein